VFEMPVTPDSSGPYATASSMIDLIERHRERGLPSPVDTQVLARAGVSESLIPRTLQSLHALDLIDEDGKPSESLETIRLAPETEYKQRLTEWLNYAYADVLKFVDPSKDDETQIRDGFRNYKPVGQQSRMVSLFIGLFTAAGVMPERQVQPKRVSTNGQTKVPKKAKREHTPKKQRSHIDAELPPAIAGLLSSLPSEGGSWSQEQRDKFVITFGAVIDFCYRIEKPTPVPKEEQQPADREEHK
jgi:Family of unknown function (DUF5343)